MEDNLKKKEDDLKRKEKRKECKTRQPKKKEDDLKKKLFSVPLKFRGKPLLGLAQLSKIFLCFIAILWKSKYGEEYRIHFRQAKQYIETRRGLILSVYFFYQKKTWIRFYPR
jgi:hypothetical protein